MYYNIVQEKESSVLDQQLKITITQISTDGEKASSCHFMQASKFAICASVCGPWLRLRGRAADEVMGRERQRCSRGKQADRAKTDEREEVRQPVKNKSELWPKLLSQIYQSLLRSTSRPLQMSWRERSVIWTMGLYLIAAVTLLTADWLTVRQSAEPTARLVSNHLAHIYSHTLFALRGVPTHTPRINNESSSSTSVSVWK